MENRVTEIKYIVEDAYGFMLMDEDTYKARIKHCAKILNFPKSAGFNTQEDVKRYIDKYVPVLRDAKIIWR